MSTSKKQMPSEIYVEGTLYVPKSSIKEFEGDLKIVILQRGWVMIGNLERNGSDCKLHNASIIRVWGTTEGLGEIATGGPTAATKLDKTGGVVEFDWLTVVACISCNKQNWKNYA